MSRRDHDCAGVKSRQKTVAEMIMEGYLILPQTDDEIGWSDRATVDMLAEDPW